MSIRVREERERKRGRKSEGVGWKDTKKGRNKRRKERREGVSGK